jgi:hypothetical protein
MEMRQPYRSTITPKSGKPRTRTRLSSIDGPDKDHR